jgi:hypothetical protein
LDVVSDYTDDPYWRHRYNDIDRQHADTVRIINDDITRRTAEISRLDSEIEQRKRAEESKKISGSVDSGRTSAVKYVESAKYRSSHLFEALGSPNRSHELTAESKSNVHIVRLGYSRYDGLWRDWEVRGRLADGLLSRNTLRDLIEKQLRERADPFFITDSRRMLSELEASNADAIDYLPEQLKALPRELKQRAIELLNLDNVPGAYSSDITQPIIDNARARYYRMTDATSRDAALQEIDSLAEKLGLY